ncbi:MAG: aminotransferase class I/II-fold pyridoxal phosphate-dependent enzyme [Prevotella sp.]|nr:aminotransferase class I/II-fold pyridoxal phosphate-dependent enzyme [Prevotella sp.]
MTKLPINGFEYYLNPNHCKRPEQIFLGNGSDEAIDLCYRVFCEPGRDNVVAIDPTYGMYKVCADINNVEYRPVSLDENFNIIASRLLEHTDKHTKLIWLCSPNNPTGNSLDRNELLTIMRQFQGIVVIDEAYGDFSTKNSFREELSNYPHLIVLNTMRFEYYLNPNHCKLVTGSVGLLTLLVAYQPLGSSYCYLVSS